MARCVAAALLWPTHADTSAGESLSLLQHAATWNRDLSKVDSSGIAFRSSARRCEFTKPIRGSSPGSTAHRLDMLQDMTACWTACERTWNCHSVQFTASSKSCTLLPRTFDSNYQVPTDDGDDTVVSNRQICRTLQEGQDLSELEREFDRPDLDLPQDVTEQQATETEKAVLEARKDNPGSAVGIDYDEDGQEVGTEWKPREPEPLPVKFSVGDYVQVFNPMPGNKAHEKCKDLVGRILTVSEENGRKPYQIEGMQNNEFAPGIWFASGELKPWRGNLLQKVEHCEVINGAQNEELSDILKVGDRVKVARPTPGNKAHEMYWGQESKITNIGAGKNPAKPYQLEGMSSNQFSKNVFFGADELELANEQ